MIHIVWATIRPLFFKSAHSIWLSRSKNPSNITSHIGINDESHYDVIHEYLNNTKQAFRIVKVAPKQIGVCYPGYCISSTVEGNDGDIVIFASDDFLPPQDWDVYVTNKLANKSGCLMVRDGYQLPDSSNMQYPAITIPIMTWDCFTKLNKAIYHPVYNHMYSDCELYLNLKDLNLLIDDRLTDLTVFEHHHYASGKRGADTNDQSYHTKWKVDEDTWNMRKNMKVEDRLPVSEKNLIR